MTNQPHSHRVVGEATGATEETMQSQSVPVNVYATTGALVIVAAVPAVRAPDVTIEMHPGRVRFWARVRSAPPRDYLTHEWEYGGYEREIPVPDGYGAGLEATLANGQLAIRVLRGAAAGVVRIHPSALWSHQGSA
jgi:HSP20 family molecular chaperone IbpA